MFLVSYSPWYSKDRGREAQRDNMHYSEVLEVARCAIARRVAGGKPSWSQQPFNSTGVPLTDATQRS